MKFYNREKELEVLKKADKLKSQKSIMTMLIFGSCSVENWGAIEAQLLHAFYLFGLLWYFQKNEKIVD